MVNPARKNNSGSDNGSDKAKPKTRPNIKDEEFKALIQLFLEGDRYSNQAIIDQLIDHEFPSRCLDVIKNRRREFEVIRRMIYEYEGDKLRRETDPLTIELRKQHFAELAESLKHFLEKVDYMLTTSPASTGEFTSEICLPKEYLEKHPEQKKRINKHLEQRLFDHLKTDVETLEGFDSWGEMKLGQVMIARKQLEAIAIKGVFHGKCECCPE